MNLTQKKKDSFKDLQDTFSLYEARIKELEKECKAYENKLQKVQEENFTLKHKVGSLESSAVSMAHEFGMAPKDNIYHNACLFLERNLREYRSHQEKCSDLGYSSLDNLFKAVKMMTSETKNRKTQTYYEYHLPETLLCWPITLQLTSRAGEDKVVRRYLNDSVYPVFETYLDCPHTDNDRLFELWEEVENRDDLNSLRNWCLERIHGVKEELPEDEISLEALAEDCITLAGCFNDPIRKGLAEWVSEMQIMVTRAEYKAFWDGHSYDRIARKLLTRYAGCELNQYVREALKEKGYNSPSQNSEWKESLTLKQLAAAMQAVDAIKETAEWDTDFLNAALETLGAWGKHSEECFTTPTNNYNVSD